MARRRPKLAPVRPVMRVNFMGLVGPSGQLPLVLHGTGGGTGFRRGTVRCVTSWTYSSTAPSRCSIALGKNIALRFRYERGEDDKFSSYLLSLVGLGLPSLQQRQIIDVAVDKPVRDRRSRARAAGW